MAQTIDDFATQRGAVDLDQAFVFGISPGPDGREVLSLMFPDGSTARVPAELYPGAQVGAPVPQTTAETLLAGMAASDDPLPGLPPMTPPLDQAEIAARVAALEAANPATATDPLQAEDKSFLDSLASGFQYLDLEKLGGAPRIPRSDLSVYRPRATGTGAQALKRLGIASLV
jgi:hypothetical protein